MEPHLEQNGKLAKLWRNRSTERESTDLTRVSAVLVIEEYVPQAGPSAGEIDLALTVAHNPFAVVPIPPAFFGAATQFVCEGDKMRWVLPAGGDGGPQTMAERRCRLTGPTTGTRG